MCGIAGIAAFDAATTPRMPELVAMCDSIRHRGPDADGLQILDQVALGMRRLSIIDLAGGSQPMANEDGSVRVVFNGEIYNYRELRSELRRAGHVFATNSDTEVLVHAYEEYGDSFPARLNGMFAFALHDRRRNRLLLARDHLGVKPLFYFASSRELVWGSEIKALLASGRVPRELDIDALGEFFAWEYVPGRGTLFRHIRKLEAGHMLVVELGKPAIMPVCFWDIPTDAEETDSDFDTWSARVDEKIIECVQRQLVSDVPLGAFLSGGVDSSLVVAAMGKANTFSIGFDDPSYNELEYSQAVAKHLGVSHTTQTIEPRVVDLFDHLMHFMDDPIGDFSIFPTYLVSRLARDHVTVSLSGDGGDELFGGYETYLANQRARQYRHIPAVMRRNIIEPILQGMKPRPEKKGLINKAKRFIEGMQEPESLGHARWRIFLSDARRAALFTPDAARAMNRNSGAHIESLYAKAAALQPLNQSLYVDTRSYLVDNCLVKTDRMSMAVSLEARVPLLDVELAELSFRIPDRYKIRRGETKAVLKHIAARKVPRHCVYRRKEGFSIPIKHWLGTQFRPLLDVATERSVIESQGLFEYSTIDRLKAEHLAGVANNSHILWSLIVFDNWRNKWLEVH